MSDTSKNCNKSTSQDRDDCANMKKKSNPIIFARTETTHIPKSLMHDNQPAELRNTIYSIHDDGSLKPTPLDSVDEEEEEIEIVSTKIGFWKRFFKCCIPFHSSKNTIVSEIVVQPLVSNQSPEKKRSEIEDRSSYGPFLGNQRSCDTGKKTLVLDLDETLVHSSFQPSDNCQYVIPVEIEDNIYKVYVYCRPGVSDFLKTMSKLYEIVIYTASLKKYADPLLDQIDSDHCIAYRLFRDRCVCSDGVFVKDLGLLGRDLKSVVMVDNASMSYKFQPLNGIECIPFIDDFSDKELEEMTPFLDYLSKKSDVRLFAKLWNEARAENSQMVLYK